MTRRQHILLDAFIQAAILIFYAFLMVQSSEPFTVLAILVVFLTGWQLVNALLNYKFFEGRTRILFVKVMGYSVVGICLFFGLLWFVGVLSFMTLATAGFGNQVFEFFALAVDFIWMVIPFYFGALVCWGMYLSGKDVYNILYKTI